MSNESKSGFDEIEEAGNGLSEWIGDYIEKTGNEPSYLAVASWQYSQSQAEIERLRGELQAKLEKENNVDEIIKDFEFIVEMAMQNNDEELMKKVKGVMNKYAKI
jgi:predicted CopG family antitoxin